MKFNKAIILPIMMVTSISTLTGCSQKVNYKQFSDIFVDCSNTEQNSYYFETQYGSNVYYEDCDSYIFNEIKKLQPVKRFTATDGTQRHFVYNLVHTVKTNNSDYYERYRSQMFFFINGSIVVNDYGYGVLDSYNYFTMSADDAASFFKMAEDKFDANDNAIQQDRDSTKTDKSIDAFLNALTNQETIIGNVSKNGYSSRNDYETFTDDGALLRTLKNVEYNYFATEECEKYILEDRNLLFYNFAKEDIGNEIKQAWFLTLENNYRYVRVYNMMERDSLNRPNIAYVNVYSISKEAGVTIYNEAKKQLG